MSQVTSPYNFVPAPTEDQVYKPEWAGQVSHDIPFSDGESGEIEIKITAQTPIFIRNGHSKTQEMNEFSHYFDKDGGKHYFIPGSSLKGMFRNVLEIMSFSRMDKKLVNDDRYSYRDLTRNSLYLSKYRNQKIHGGWLKEKQDGSWEIEESESLAFIHHSELKKKGFPFKDLFYFKTPSEKEKNAEFKYNVSKQKGLKFEFAFEQSIKQLFGNVSRNMAHFSEKGKKGTLVFTGQSSQRKEYDDPNRRSSGKVHEFVFFDAEKPNIIEVEPKMQKDFKFIYLDHDKNNISTDWKYWRNDFLEKGKKVPVFFSKDSNGKLNHFGLAYMYKLPFSNSIHQLSPINQYKKDLDFATTIFGFADKEDALKGRVMIGNAMSTDAKAIANKKEILGGPKASYFPFYLAQKVNTDGKVNSYNTYENNNAALRGFKRYPVHSTINTGHYDENQLKNQKVFSEFRPLDTNTSFSCKMRFHNLKKVEIGALIAAISFNGKPNCFHSLGGAKSFGYGKVKVEVSGVKFLNSEHNIYLNEFKVFMNQKVKDWEKSPQLKELFAMASNTTDAPLTYPTIDDFVSIKRDKEALYCFSEIEQPKVQIQPLNRRETGLAKVTVIRGRTIQAQLIEGSDLKSKTLEIPNHLLNQKPRKVGEKIKVKIIYKGSRVEKLEIIAKNI